MQKRRRKEKMYNNSKFKDIFHFLPIIFIIVIVPLIMYGKVVRLPLNEADFWKGGVIHFDFSAYYKSIFL